MELELPCGFLVGVMNALSSFGGLSASAGVSAMVEVRRALELVLRLFSVWLMLLAMTILIGTVCFGIRVNLSSKNSCACGKIV